MDTVIIEMPNYIIRTPATPCRGLNCVSISEVLHHHIETLHQIIFVYLNVNTPRKSFFEPKKTITDGEDQQVLGYHPNSPALIVIPRGTLN